MPLDPSALLSEGRRFVRPIAWRGTEPDPSAVDSLLFPRERRARSFDGTPIAYSVFGRKGSWVALVPGYCCPDNFWKYLVPALRERHRVIVWDLRGLGLSGLPREPGYRARNLSIDDFSIEANARDLEAVLDDAGARRAALVGHSMGGQIILEAYRRFPDRVSALVSLTAPFESPIRTFYGRDFTRFVQAVNATIRSFPRPAIVLWRALFANPTLSNKLAQLIRALGPHAKVEDMAPYYRHMAGLDPLIMLKMAEAMRTHSAADVLPSVKVPTLIVTGTLDTFTPPAIGEAMREEIPRAELVVIDEASHGAVIEKPDEVNAAVLDFLRRRVDRAARKPSGKRKVSPAKRRTAPTRVRAKARKAEAS